MKKSAFIIMTLLLFCFYTRAQEPISFRSQALGGIVQDDLDLIYDPIQLRFVDGIHLYTNLSNLTSYNEEVFNNASDHEFLFGATIGNPFLKNLWTSALLRYQNSHASNPISIDSDLNGFDDIFSEGNFKDIYNAYLDTDFNGLYDVRKEIVQEKTNFTLNKKNIFVLNNAYLFNKMTFGLKATIGCFEGEGTTASNSLGSGFGLLSGSNFNDPSFTLNSKDYLIEEDFNNLAWNENGDFLSGYNNDFTAFDLAVMRPFKFIYVDTVEIRADIGYINNNSKDSYNDMYSGNQEYYSQDIPGFKNAYSETDNSTYQMERSGSTYKFHLQARHKFKKAKRRVDEGYWNVNFGYHTGSFDYNMTRNHNFNRNEYYFDGTDTLFSDYEDDFNNTFSETDKGDESYSMFHSSCRINIPLGESVFIGTGFALDYTSIERNTNYLENNSSLNDYEEIDTLLSNDFTTSVTSKMMADRTFEQTIYHVRIPVGIEYKFTESKNWSIRFGSIFEYIKIINNDKKEITTSEPRKTVKEYADGSNPIVTFNDNEYVSTSSHKKDAESITTFVYGLGYQPTENLQIDLLGFLGTTAGLEIIDADFFKRLRLSISVKI